MNKDIKTSRKHNENEEILPKTSVSRCEALKNGGSSARKKPSFPPTPENGAAMISESDETVSRFDAENGLPIAETPVDPRGTALTSEISDKNGFSSDLSESGDSTKKGIEKTEDCAPICEITENAEETETVSETTEPAVSPDISDNENEAKTEAAHTNGKPKKPESKKKKWAKRILLIAVFAFTFYAMYLMSTALNGGEVASLGKIFASADMRFFAVAIGLAALLILFDAFKYAILSRMTVGSYHYGTCLTAGIIGKFYDNITPFAAGGQPFQMVHFAKKDYPTGVATAIPTLKYIIQLYVYIAVSIVLYIANPDAIGYLDPTSRGVIQTACYVGLVFAVSAPSLFVFFSVAPKAADKVVCFFLKILCKLKIVKNFDETHKKVFLFVIGYQTAFKQLSKKYGGIIFLILFCIIDCLLYFALPYFLLVGMGGTSPDWKLLIDVVTLNSYSFFAASLIPTPGNSGAIEASYSMVFAPVAVASGTLFWIVFIWRFLTYYCYIFIGLVYNLSAFIQNKFRKRKNRFSSED